MEIIISGKLTIKEGAEIIQKTKGLYNEKITFNLLGLDFIDTTASNILLLLPFMLKNSGNFVSIVIDRDKRVYSWLEKIGILDKFFNNFDVNGRKPNRQLVSFYNEKYNELGIRTFFLQNECDYKILTDISHYCEEMLPKKYAISNRISTCIVELIYNIFDHSEEKFGAISIHFLKSNLQIAVTDFGIGIKNSLLKSEVFSPYSNETDAFFIKKAIEINVSSTNLSNRGFGLYLVTKYADRTYIATGNSALSLYNDGKKKNNSTFIDYFQGTNINCILSLEKEKTDIDVIESAKTNENNEKFTMEQPTLENLKNDEFRRGVEGLIEGLWIEHHDFGKGQVINIKDNERAEIAFKNLGTKHLVLKYAPLKILNNHR